MTAHERTPGAGDKRPGAIFLAGFMGSGKSTVGRALADRLGWEFIDLDDEIERRAGQTIPEIFAQHGEDGFREREHAALREQADLSRAGSPRVLALGGGTYANARNQDLLRSAGATLWLDADASTLWERVRHEAHRPLARDHRAFLQLHATRQVAYAKADSRVDASADPAAVLQQIFELGWVQGLRADG